MAPSATPEDERSNAKDAKKRKERKAFRRWGRSSPFAILALFGVLCVALFGFQQAAWMEAAQPDP
jgi:hypothetical protein